MSRTFASLKIEFTVGTDISDAAQEGMRLANKLDILVEFKFNNVTCFCRPAENWQSIPFEYEEAQKSKSQYKFASSSPIKLPAKPTIHHGEDNLQYLSAKQENGGMLDKMLDAVSEREEMWRKLTSSISGAKPETGYPTIDRQEEKKDWEIVETSNKVDGVHCYVKNGCEDFKCEIHSVRRLSDDEVFSVGDEDEYGKKIEGFLIEDKWIGGMCACFTGNTAHTSIMFLKKKQPKPEERISVGYLTEHDTLKGNKWDSFWYQVCFSKPIPKDKFQLIKQAIWAVINNVEFHNIPGVMWGETKFKTEKLYTESQLTEARGEAFEAGRDGKPGFYNMTFIYPTFEDYEKSLNQSK